MNVRIKELALEARLGPALLLQHWGKIDALTDSEQEGLEQIKKFAELIVKECADIATINSNQWHSAGTYVLKHFGVEK
jgi:hypothetical protein